MRPANFPTIRLAQFAQLLHQSVHLFSTILETDDIKKVFKLFEVTASEFWNTHYTFGNQSDTASPKQIGKSFIGNLLYS